MNSHAYTINDVAVVIPVYKEILTEPEIISLTQCFKILSAYKIILVAPKGLNLSSYHLVVGTYEVINFDVKNFRNIAAYNQLMVSPGFYKTFLKYNFILIHQLDAFVFYDSLLDWCQQDYDYIGAPWITAPWREKLINKLKFSFLTSWLNPVGNGGLSLRKVKSAYKYASAYRIITFFFVKIFNEDVFWSSFVNAITPKYKVAPLDKAINFAFEDHPSEAYVLNGSKLPFGCHAWEKYDFSFWKPHIDQQGFKVKQDECS